MLDIDFIKEKQIYKRYSIALEKDSSIVDIDYSMPDMQPDYKTDKDTKELTISDRKGSISIFIEDLSDLDVKLVNSNLEISIYYIFPNSKIASYKEHRLNIEAISSRIDINIAYLSKIRSLIDYKIRGLDSEAKLNLIFGSTNKLRSKIASEQIGRSSIEINSLAYADNGMIDLEIVSSNIDNGTRSLIVERAIAKNSSKIFIKALSYSLSKAVGSFSNIIQEGFAYDRDSHIAALPDMHVETNNLIAKHSAYSGPIDEEKLFYLMSRGIDKESSKLLFTDGQIMSVACRSNNDNFIRYALELIGKEYLYTFTVDNEFRESINRLYKNYYS
ncbi:MAG: hypothetical protein ARM1_0331 [Candidatus Micrarchaeota archaeon]|nr:MAG: hypothetical protein ARM1_0331 [Candidatus Micrarchaeota archaeon]